MHPTGVLGLVRTLYAHVSCDISCAVHALFAGALCPGVFCELADEKLKVILQDDALDFKLFHNAMTHLLLYCFRVPICGGWPRLCQTQQSPGLSRESWLGALSYNVEQPKNEIHQMRGFSSWECAIFDTMLFFLIPSF